MQLWRSSRQKLKANGLTIEKFRAQIKKNMERNRLMERVLTSKVLITDQQVEAYLKRGERGVRSRLPKRYAWV